MPALLQIRDLRLEFGTMHGVAPVLDGVSLSVDRGEVLGLVGESGCGKTVTGLASIGLIPRPPGRFTGGEIRFQDRDLLKGGERAWKGVRGARIGMVFQDPATALNPAFSVGQQLLAVIGRHRRLRGAKAQAEARRLLGLVGLPDSEAILGAYPHQLSGGQRQRVCIALALAPEPELVIADEPTTALDVTIQAQILHLLLQLRDRLGIAVILITHDVGVAAQVCDRVAVMYAGRVVEQGATRAVLKTPQHPYTQGLLGSVPGSGRSVEDLATLPGSVPSLLAPPPGCRFHPRCDRATSVCRAEAPALAGIAADQAVACLYPGPRPVVTAAMGQSPAPPLGQPPAVAAAEPPPLVKVQDLFVHLPVERGWLGRPRRVVRAVDGLSLTLQPGETLALVGESGCGKTTVARTLLGLVAPTAGTVHFGDRQPWRLAAREQRCFRRYLQIVFQDPYASLDPRFSVLQSVAEPLVAQRVHPKEGLENRIAGLLERVGLGREHLWRRPHQLSGGQCQRVAIARALALEPQLLVLDEPTSALDVSVQARILALLKELQRDLGLSYLFITHDLAVVEAVADRVAIMYLGRLVETGPTPRVFARPLHPYTQALLSSVPSPDPDRRGQWVPLAGGIPSALTPPSGCRFHTRCSVRRPECESTDPPSTDLGAAGSVACLLLATEAESEPAVAGRWER